MVKKFQYFCQKKILEINFLVKNVFGHFYFQLLSIDVNCSHFANWHSRLSEMGYKNLMIRLDAIVKTSDRQHYQYTQLSCMGSWGFLMANLHLNRSFDATWKLIFRRQVCAVIVFIGSKNATYILRTPNSDKIIIW